jgi:hypothetical protein
MWHPETASRVPRNSISGNPRVRIPSPPEYPFPENIRFRGGGGSGILSRSQFFAGQRLRFCTTMHRSSGAKEMKTRARSGLIAGAVLLLIGGCSSANKPTAENFINALNAYYTDHSDCLFPQGHTFPYEVAPGPTAKEEKAEMDALTDAGLLTRLEDRDMHVDRYTLNAAGNRFAPRFCYGHRQVTSVVSFTPPGPRNGFTETTVTYHYTMMDVPVWASTDQVKAGFPALAKSVGDNPTDQATLATAGAGWQVPQ